MRNQLITVVDPAGDGDRVGGVAGEVARLLALDVRAVPADAGAEEVVELLAGPDAGGCVLPVRAGPDERCWQVAAATTKPVILVPPTASLRRPRIERALLPLDGSEETASALESATEPLLRAGVELVVLHVFEPATVPAFWDQRAHAEQAWAGAFASRHGAPADARTALRRGTPATQLLRAARLEEVDLIVLVWSGTSAAGRARTVRDSVAAATVPVLLQRRGDGRSKEREMPANWRRSAPDPQREREPATSR